MADDKLRYFIEAIWTGKGAAVAAKEDIKGVGEAAKGGDGNLKGLNNMLSNITAGLAAAGGAAAVFKTAFDLAEQGDQIQRTKQKFDALAETIHTTGDALLTGLREATHGAVSDLELLTAGTTFMNMGFVRSQDEAESLIQKILLLKKPTEDTGTAIDNFSLMLANASVARLDSFGLSSGRVKARMEELQKATAGMTREQAFTIATMEEMSVAIDRQGLSVENLGTSYERLRALGVNWLNEQKSMLDEGLEPWISLLLGDYGTAATNAIDANIKQAQTLEDLKTQLDGVQEASVTWGVKFTGTADDIEAGRSKIVAAMAANASSFEEFQKVLESSAGVSVYTNRTVQQNIYDSVKAGQLLAATMGNVGQALGQQSAKVDAQHAAQIAAADSARDLAHSQGELGAASDQLNEQWERQADVAAHAEENIAAMNERIAEGEKIHAAAVAEFERLTTVIDGARQPVNDLTQAQSDLNAIQTDWATVSETTNMTASEAAEEAQGRIDAANKAISDSYKQAALDIALANIGEQYKGDALAAQEAYLSLQVALGVITQAQADSILGVASAQERVKDATQILTDQYLSDGQLTREESEKIATAVHLIEQGFTGSGDALAAFVDMGITDLSQIRNYSNDASDAVMGLKDNAEEFSGASPYEASVGIDTGDSTDRLNTIKSLMDNLDGRHVRSTVEVDDQSGGGGGGSGNDKGGDKGNASSASSMMANFAVGNAAKVTGRDRNGGINFGGVTLQIFVNGADMGKNPKGAARMLASNVIGELQAMVG